jgi:hypothetical protein
MQGEGDMQSVDRRPAGHPDCWDGLIHIPALISHGSWDHAMHVSLGRNLTASEGIEPLLMDGFAANAWME